LPPADRTALIGRDAERERLRALLDAARSGRGGAVVLRGEPGVGKTALLDDLRRAADGVRVLSARGIESESRLAFAGLADVLRPVLDRLDRVPEAQRAALQAALALGPPAVPDRFAAYAATLSLLGAVAAEGPVLVTVDDGHWLDVPSQEALLFCARRLGDDPVLFVATARERPPEDLDVSDIEELAVGALGPDAARRLLAAVTADEPLAPEIAEELHGIAGGNPLALVELPRELTPDQRAGRAPLPRIPSAGDALAQAYRHRMTALSAPARRAVLLAALSGDGSATPIVAAIGGADAAGALAEAEAAGVLTIGGEAVRFRHPLLRSVAVDLADPTERRAAHRALAGALADEVELEQRAWHVAEAAVGPDEEAAALLEAAAARAAARTGYAAAASALERAAELTPAPERAALRRLSAAGLALAAGRTRRALRLAERARADARDPRLVAQAGHLIGRCLIVEGPVDRAQEVLLGGARAVEDADPRTAVPALIVAAVTCLMAGDFDANVALARRAVLAARAARDEAGLTGAGAALGAGLLLTGGRRLVPPLLEPMKRRAPEMDPLAPEYEMALYAAYAWARTGTIDLALSTIERVVEAARAAGAATLLPYALIVQADIEFWRGHWPQALAAADESVALLDEIGSPTLRSRGLATRAMIGAALDRDEQCRVDARDSIALAEAQGVGSMVTFSTWVLGFAALATGRPQEAAAHLERVAALAARQGLREPAMLPWQPDLVEAYVRTGRGGEARRVLASLSERAHATGGAWARAATCRCRGLIDDDLDRHFREALAWHERDPMPFERARTELAYGSRLRRTGRRADARAQLEPALAAFEELGASAWGRQAREEIAAGGARLRPRRAARADDTLSPRELQVATAAAEGLTNREVAARLFLSEKTVERHLGSVYRKLGLRSRTELARRFAAGPPAEGG
jgi:DNA-binding CsgD family transcriptional regulator